MSPPLHELEVLFIDMNAYFASVEQMDRPELRGQAHRSHAREHRLGLLHRQQLRS